MPTPRVFVLGALFTTDVEGDDWMIANFALYHELAKHSGGDWLTMVDLPDRSRWNLHGHAHAERVVIGDEHDDPMRHDKIDGARFQAVVMAKLNGYFTQMVKGDRLVIFFLGHGVGVGVDKGALLIGTTNSALKPEYFFANRMLVETLGDVTVVVDCCYSGAWIEKAQVLSEKPLGSSIEILCGANAQEETLSWGESGSQRRRGGIFANFVAASVHGEFDLHFPRPRVLEANGQQYVDVFPPANIQNAQQDTKFQFRSSWPSLKKMSQEMANGMRKLSDIYPHPTHAEHSPMHAPPSMDGLAALGYAEGRGFGPSLNRLVPANPPTHFDAGHRTGCGSLYGERTGSDYLSWRIKTYVDGPHYPEESSSETKIFGRMRRYMKTKEHDAELLAMLDRRIAARSNAAMFARYHGLPLPTIWTRPTDERQVLLESNREIFEKFAVSDPGITSWCVPVDLCLQAFLDANMVPRMQRSTLRRKLPCLAAEDAGALTVSGAQRLSSVTAW